MPEPTGNGNEWWRWLLLFVYGSIYCFGMSALLYWAGPKLGSQFSSYWNAFGWSVGFFVLAIAGGPLMKFLDRFHQYQDETLERRKKELEAERQSIIAAARARQDSK